MLVIGLVVLALVLQARDAPNDDGAQNAPVIEAPSGDSQTTAPTDDKMELASSFEQITEAEAVAKAEQEGIPHRVVVRDEEPIPITMDLNENRINFTVENGTVIRAEFY